MAESRYRQALDILKRAGVSYGKLFTEENGQYSEVQA